ncbi:hypothetical protein ACFV3R_00035 [Streptomyces sp. NPDC059740]|uniref:hypothetical protein n=1 Tax=Streptomyces sp. NPDC059740 TaxID=3346926 RepID=UPI003664194F
MSEKRSERDAAPRESAPGKTAAGPQPEEIRFFGTTWLEHDGGYALRRAALALGSLLLAVLGALLLRFGFEGLRLAAVGSLVNVLVVACFGICSALAFRRTWDRFVRRPDPEAPTAADRSSQSMMTIGFIGSLLAWFCRSLVEAPGERLHRAEYEEACARYARRRGARTGNPAARRGGTAGKRAARS